MSSAALRFLYAFCGAAIGVGLLTEESMVGSDAFAFVRAIFCASIVTIAVDTLVDFVRDLFK